MIKHAQRVIEDVIKSQRIKPFKLPENHEFYQAQLESIGMFDEVETANKGNLSHLKTGMAQHYRVNNPYRYISADEYGNSNYKSLPWGCYKEAEIGGNKSANAGALYDFMKNENYVNMENSKKLTARIYYVQHSHMHRMSSMRQANGTGGPYQILFEEDGGFKNPLDGFNRTFTPSQWVLKGFKTVNQAVALCQSFGCAYEVELPRHRYVTRKSYADNFKYRPLKSDD